MPPKFDGVVITPDTIKTHLQRTQDAEEYIGRFGAKPQAVTYLNTLHQQSTEYLEVMQAEMERLQKVVRAYDEAAKAMKVQR